MTIRRSLGLGFVLAFLLLVPIPGRAQTARDSVVGRAVTTLQPGNRIRVALLRERWTGRYQGYNGDTLFLGAKGGPPMAIRFNAVDSLWRGARAWRRGGVIGGVVGAALGAVIIGAIAADGGNQEDIVPALVMGAAGGAGGGALYGVAIGSLFRSWKRIYPRAE